MHFGGIRFRDFMTHFRLGTRSGQAPEPERRPEDLYRYVYLATPNEDYYVGLDMASALHPQTLLCDTMNWRPLTREHGAPLRLYLAVKYGYKSLKRIGPDPLPRPAAARLLGRSRLRLVRGTLTVTLIRRYKAT